jgi:hypothetical protein
VKKEQVKSERSQQRQHWVITAKILRVQKQSKVDVCSNKFGLQYLLFKTKRMQTVQTLDLVKL